MDLTLSTKSIQDLRVALKAFYDESFCDDFTDEDLQEIGKALLIVTAEHLKLKACVS